MFEIYTMMVDILFTIYDFGIWIIPIIWSYIGWIVKPLIPFILLYNNMGFTFFLFSYFLL